MKKLYILAALLMATTAAHAGNSISFEIQGRKIHIEAPQNCDSLSCLKISGFDLKNLKSNRLDDEDTAANPPVPAPAAQSAVPPAPPAPAAEYEAPRAPSAPVARAEPAPVNPPPASVATLTPPAVVTPAPQAVPAPVAPKPAAIAATSPLGVWNTEENKGQVRVETCGQNLCGYAVKTGEKILIDMKPTTDTAWKGQIHDPDSGKNYDSTIKLRGPNALRVQGCAFGGMFCGGQTWTRVS
jgi:uncharacterized protein (DUF2147 family)